MVDVVPDTVTQHSNKVDSMSNSVEYKGYSIVSDGTFGYKGIKPIGKGSVPKGLRGVYTNTSFARSAIDALKVEAVVKDVKKGS